jgi:hypothetical protein
MKWVFSYAARPGAIITAFCVVSFLIQISLLAAKYIKPSETITTTEKKDISEIDFPLDFKICLKPGFNQSALREVGYEDVTDYFIGKSRLKH